VRAAGRLRAWDEVKNEWLLDEENESGSISTSGSGGGSGLFGSDNATSSNSSVAGKRANLRKNERQSFKAGGVIIDSDVSDISKSAEPTKRRRERRPPSSPSLSTSADLWDG